jgi:hypothetical protein
VSSPFSIDELRLDREWLAQAELVHEHCLNLADAKLRHNEAKAEADVVAAELDRDVRLHPTKYGLDKLTETVVANTITLQPAHKEAHKKLIQAKHDVDVLEAAVSALEHKKRALENLVALHGMDYFATPSTKRAGAKAEDTLTGQSFRRTGGVTREEVTKSKSKR